MMDPLVRATTHALMNHLWQSTLFAVAAGLLTLALRKNGAHTRYWVWCAASYKFLIPFSLLTAVGSSLSWRSAPAALVPPMLGQFVQPFSTAADVVPVVATSPASSAGMNPLWIWMSAWACGTIAVGVYWMVRWLRIRSAVRNAIPLPMDAPIQVRSSRMLIEPGVVGLFRPVLLLPAGISERLTPQQLQTILTHELCHVRRRDNLTAAIHMLVEALFWFHPLVWWLGRWLIVEREGACDEAVIASGGDREAYAEALLTVCKFYVEPPLASAAGISGADLQKRIFRIMNDRVVRKLDFGKKLLLGAAGLVVVAAPVVFGVVNAKQSGDRSQTENTAVVVPAAINRENPARYRGESRAENKAAGLTGGIEGYIEALGVVTPVNTVSVTSRVQGQIMEVHYAEGQTVYKGDPLLDIDPRPYQAALTQMEGQLVHDQAVLNETRMNANPMQMVDNQDQAVQRDEGTVQNDEGKVRNARWNLEYCHITSPIAGRVGLRLVDVGNLVQANGTTPLVVVAQLQPITVIFSVAEDYLPQILRQFQLGQRLTVDVFDRTQTKKIASGYLRTVDNQIDPTTGMVKLRAIFPNTDSSLFPNQFVNVRLFMDTEHGAALAPTPTSHVESIPTSEPALVFDVASVKPNKLGSGVAKMVFTSDGFAARDATLPLLVLTAYGGSSVSGLPKWLNFERYDVDAKTDSSVADRLRKLNPNQRNLENHRMLQTLLEDRFKLTLHRETEERQVYSLVIAKNGPRLQEAKPGETYPHGITGPDGRRGAGTVGVGSDGGLTFQGLPIGTLASVLSAQLGCTVLDKTGLTGNYDFTLPWTPDQNKGPTFDGMDSSQQGTRNTSPPESSGPSIFTAIQKQLGLKLESEVGPFETIVIDHVEEPRAN